MCWLLCRCYRIVLSLTARTYFNSLLLVAAIQFTQKFPDISFEGILGKIIWLPVGVILVAVYVHVMYKQIPY